MITTTLLQTNLLPKLDKNCKKALLSITEGAWIWVKFCYTIYEKPLITVNNYNFTNFHSLSIKLMSLFYKFKTLMWSVAKK